MTTTIDNPLVPTILSQIAEAVPQLNINARIDEYFQKLDLLGIEPELKALIGNAIYSYLSHFVEIGKPWAAQFLFPPQLDPTREIIAPDGESPAIATDLFRKIHVKRNLRLISEITERLVFSPPSAVFINGPMYSAKSGLAAMIHGALSRTIEPENIHTYIRRGMSEDSIHARSLPGNNIPAQPVSLNEFGQEVDRLVNMNIGGSTFERHFVVLEEATFMASAETPEEELVNAQIFKNLIKKLTENNISAILIGLAKNYRHVDLPVTAALRENGLPITFEACSSFHLHNSPEGMRITPAQTTGRYSEGLGMWDLLFPIVVPRNDAPGIVYAPLPQEYHPMNVLAKIAPELHAILLGISRQDLLRKHTEMVGSAIINTSVEG